MYVYVRDKKYTTSTIVLEDSPTDSFTILELQIPLYDVR